MEETTYLYPSSPNKSNKKLPIIIGVFILLAVFIAVLFAFRQPKKVDEVKDVVVVTKEPTPIEKPKIDIATVKIQVVNGTGTPGQAGIVVKALEGAGYNPENIKTGNTDKFDTIVTTITARDNFEEIVNNIKDILKPTFNEISVGTQKLNGDSEFDIKVVTGGKIFEEVTPTVSATGTLSPTPTVSPTLTSTPTPTPRP